MFRNIFFDEKGVAYTLFLLLMLPLTFTMLLSTTEIVRVSGGSNIDLKKAVEMSVKGAALRVDSESQAHGDPKIIPDSAHESFRKILAKNMKLDETLRPIPAGSGFKEPVRYWLLIYNQENAGIYGLAEFTVYYFSSETGIIEQLQTDNLSETTGGGRRFFISDAGFLTVANRELAQRKVVLDIPGVIAIVQAEIRPVMTAKGELATRWSAAKIVIK